MTPADLSKFRAAERTRTAPMREAARHAAFVQGWLHAKFGDVSAQPDYVLVAALPEVDEAYRAWAGKRGPA